MSQSLRYISREHSGFTFPGQVTHAPDTYLLMYAIRTGGGQRLLIGAMQYQVCEHPMARGMPYGQEGRAGIVYKLSPVAGSACALKVFNPRNRDPSLVNLASHLDQFATMPGLSACRHSILTPRTDGQLLREFPDLMYAAMMRWIPGYTWADTMQGNEELTAAESLRLAHGLAEGLQRMEERGLAHCDLSGANVLLPDLAPDTCNATHPVELVDVEQMYAADLPRPRVLPAGSPGYAHRSVSTGDWSPRSDRFAGALLLAEILGWCDSTARSYGAGKHSSIRPKSRTMRARRIASYARCWTNVGAHPCVDFWIRRGTAKRWPIAQVSATGWWHSQSRPKPHVTTRRPRAYPGQQPPRPRRHQ